MSPELGTIQVHRGIAGQVSYSVAVTYPGEPTETITFIGNTYGGPVVMRTARGTEVFVHEPSRLGDFAPSWVLNFFADRES